MYKNAEPMITNLAEKNSVANRFVAELRDTD